MTHAPISVLISDAGTPDIVDSKSTRLEIHRRRPFL